MSTLKLNGVTSGSSIIKAPDSGSSGVTFTLPASAGTLAKTTDITSVGGATGVDFNDNVAARWGTGNDLSISTNGSNSYINNTGSGDLLIRGNDVKIQGTTSSESMAHFVEDGGVELYHNNVKKLETTSAGFTLTGTAGTSPVLELNNADTEDNDTGRESSLRFTGNRSGGEDVINAQISGHHDGSADDDKGMMLFYTNGGSGSVQQLKITNDGRGLSQFTAKAWIHFKGTGTISITDSHNCSSITDHGTGNYTVTMANAMANSNYMWQGTCMGYVNWYPSIFAHGNVAQTTTTIRVGTADAYSNSGWQDTPKIGVLVFGD
jgi:hypothetical protein